MTAGRLAGWWPTIASGLLWGIAVGVLDTLGEPIDDLSTEDLALFGAVVFLQWLLVGQLWAAVARFVEPRGQALLGYVAALPVCSGVTALTSVLIQHAIVTGATDTSTWLVNDASGSSIIPYLAWENAFYGAIYMLGYVATRRGVRLRQRVAETLRARVQADMLLREAQLRAYRGQLQPDLLIETLATIRKLARHDPTAADTMFDQLVTFLRAAMPAIRTGHSTLIGELKTLKTYGALRGLLLGGKTDVEVTWREPIADAPFPPLVLLPAVEAAANGLSTHSRLILRARSTHSGSVLNLLVAGAPFRLPDDIISHIHATLRLAFGDGVRVISGGRHGLALHIRFNAPLSAALQPGGAHASS